MVWPPIHFVSLTFAGCPLQLYLLRMFCSGVYRKIRFRIWFFQMSFDKSLIKCENFFPVYCHTWKNIENEQKPISSSCIATEFVIPLYFFYWDFWNYVSVIVIIISNNTVLECYLLWIFVSIRRLQPHSVHWGLNPSPPQKHNPFFCQVPS